MNLSQAILATLAYHDIFNYPLSPQELHTYLIKVKVPETSLNTQLSKLIKSKIIQEKKGYFTLKNRLNMIQTRQQRAKYSVVKLKKANIYAKLLGLIPTVNFVGISGALSMRNSTKNDDIDLVIITKANTLWATRFLSNALLFPVKRRPASQKTNNRACLNLFLDESDLRIRTQNLYLAHEICQLKPIWQRNNAYSRLIKANKWIYSYLPNWTPNAEGLKSNVGEKKNNNSLVISRLALVVEILLKKFQLFYMRNKISTEIVGDTQLFFHPSDTQEWVLKEYNKRLKSLRIYNKDI